MFSGGIQRLSEVAIQSPGYNPSTRCGVELHIASKAVETLRRATLRCSTHKVKCNDIVHLCEDVLYRLSEVLANGQVGPVLLRSVSQVTHAAEDACEVVLRSARQNRLVASLNYSSIEKQLSVQRDALQAVLTQFSSQPTSSIAFSPSGSVPATPFALSTRTPMDATNAPSLDVFPVGRIRASDRTSINALTFLPGHPPATPPQLLVVLQSAAEVYSASLSHFCSSVKYRNPSMRITATVQEQGSSNVWTGHQGGTVRLYMAADGAGGSKRSAWGMLSHTQGGDSGAALTPFRSPNQVRFQPPAAPTPGATSMHTPSANPIVTRQRLGQQHPVLRQQHSSDEDSPMLSGGSVLLASQTPSPSQRHSGATQPSFNAFNNASMGGGETRGVRLGPRAPHLLTYPSTMDPFKRAQRLVSTIGPVRQKLQEGEAPSDVTIKVCDCAVTALASCDAGSLWVGDSAGNLTSLSPSEIGAVLQVLVSTRSSGNLKAGVTALLVQGGIVFAATAAKRMVAFCCSDGASAGEAGYGDYGSCCSLAGVSWGGSGSSSATSLVGSSAPVSPNAPCPCRLLSGHEFGILCLWDMCSAGPRLVSTIGEPGPEIRGMFSYPDLGMLVVAFLSGNLSMCPLPRKDLAPPRPPLGGFSHWNMRCSVFKAHKGRLTACAAMGCSIATGSAAGGVKIVDARDLHAQALQDGISFGPGLALQPSRAISVASGTFPSPRTTQPSQRTSEIQRLEFHSTTPTTPSTRNIGGPTDPYPTDDPFAPQMPMHSRLLRANMQPTADPRQPHSPASNASRKNNQHYPSAHPVYWEGSGGGNLPGTPPYPRVDPIQHPQQTYSGQPNTGLRSIPVSPPIAAFLLRSDPLHNSMTSSIMSGWDGGRTSRNSGLLDTSTSNLSSQLQRGNSLSSQDDGINLHQGVGTVNPGRRLSDEMQHAPRSEPRRPAASRNVDLGARSNTQSIPAIPTAKVASPYDLASSQGFVSRSASNPAGFRSSLPTVPESLMSPDRGDQPAPGTQHSPFSLAQRGGPPSDVDSTQRANSDAYSEFSVDDSLSRGTIGTPSHLLTRPHPPAASAKQPQMGKLYLKHQKEHEEQRIPRSGGSAAGTWDGRRDILGLSGMATTSQKTLLRSNSGMSAGSHTSGHSSDGLEEADPSIDLKQQAANKKRMRTVKRIRNSATIIRWSDIHVGAKIGEGSEGTVWRGTFMHGPVAIKEMHPREHRKTSFSRVASMCDSIHHYIGGVPLMELRALDPVLKEVSTFMDLHHPYIVRYIGIVLDPPRIITEYHERGSLYQVIKRTRSEERDVRERARRDLDWGNRLQMLRDIASGMSYLHMRNYIHGDLRSPNVLLSSEGHCKIADFGFAKLMGTDEGDSFTAAKVTNPRWLAPEALKVHSISSKSDVFSFAIIMFEMLTWQLPYDGLMSIQVSHQLDRRPDLRPTLPDELPVPNVATVRGYVALMQDCWKTNPAERPDFNTISIRLRALMHWQTCMAKVRLHVKATAAVWSLSNWVRLRAAAANPPTLPAPDTNSSGRLNVSTISCTAAEAAVAHADRLLNPAQAGLSHLAPNNRATASAAHTGAAELQGRYSLRAGAAGLPSNTPPSRHSGSQRNSATPTFGRMNSLPSSPYLGFQAGGSLRREPQRSERVRYPLVASGSPPVQSTHSASPPPHASPSARAASQGSGQQQQQSQQHGPTQGGGGGPTLAAVHAAAARHHESPLARLRSSQNPELYGSTMTMTVAESCILESPQDSATPTDSGTLSTRSSTRALHSRRSWTATAMPAPTLQPSRQPHPFPAAQQPQPVSNVAPSTHPVTEAWLATPLLASVFPTAQQRSPPNYLRSTSTPLRAAPPLTTEYPLPFVTPATTQVTAFQDYQSPPLTSAVLQAANIRAQRTLSSNVPPTLLRNSTTAIQRQELLLSSGGPRASFTPPPANSEASSSMNLQPHHSSSLGPSDSGALTDGTIGDTSTSSLLRARSINAGSLSVLQTRHSSTGDEFVSRGQSMIGSSGMWSPVSGNSSTPTKLIAVRSTRKMSTDDEHSSPREAGSGDASGSAVWNDNTTPDSVGGGDALGWVKDQLGPVQRHPDQLLPPFTRDSNILPILLLHPIRPQAPTSSAPLSSRSSLRSVPTSPSEFTNTSRASSLQIMRNSTEFSNTSRASSLQITRNSSALGSGGGLDTGSPSSSALTTSPPSPLFLAAPYLMPSPFTHSSSSHIDDDEEEDEDQEESRAAALAAAKLRTKQQTAVQTSRLKPKSVTAPQQGPHTPSKSSTPTSSLFTSAATSRAAAATSGHIPSSVPTTSHPPPPAATSTALRADMHPAAHLPSSTDGQGDCSPPSSPGLSPASEASPTSSIVFPLGPAASGSQAWPSEWLAGTLANGRDSIQLHSIFANCSINLDSSEDDDAEEQQPIQQATSQTVISAQVASPTPRPASPASGGTVFRGAVLVTVPAQSHPGQRPSTEQPHQSQPPQTKPHQSRSDSGGPGSDREDVEGRRDRGRGSDTLRNIPLYMRRSVIESLAANAELLGQQAQTMGSSPDSDGPSTVETSKVVYPIPHLSFADRLDSEGSGPDLTAAAPSAALLVALGRVGPSLSFGSQFTGVSTPAAMAAQTALATSRGSQRLPTAFDAMHNPPASRPIDDDEDEDGLPIAAASSPQYSNWSRHTGTGGNTLHSTLMARIGDGGGSAADGHTLTDSSSLTISEPTHSSASGGSSRTVPSQASLHASTVSAAPSIDAQHGIALTPMHSTHIAGGAGIDLDFSLSSSGENSSHGVNSPPGRYRPYEQPPRINTDMMMMGGGVEFLEEEEEEDQDAQDMFGAVALPIPSPGLLATVAAGNTSPTRAIPRYNPLTGQGHPRY